MSIKSVWDNEGETADRYTVVFNEHERCRPGFPDLFTALGMSDNPTHPQGFSQFTSAMEGPHLGKKLAFEDLPEHIQEHIKMRME